MQGLQSYHLHRTQFHFQFWEDNTWAFLTPEKSMRKERHDGNTTARRCTTLEGICLCKQQKDNKIWREPCSSFGHCRVRSRPCESQIIQRRQFEENSMATIHAGGASSFFIPKSLWPLLMSLPALFRSACAPERSLKDPAWQTLKPSSFGSRCRLGSSACRHSCFLRVLTT